MVNNSNNILPIANIKPARLTPQQYAANFCDAHPPLTVSQANIEASRCYFCFDAPCQTACPTHIDVPSFIHRIADGNVLGAAQAIFEANPLGGMCARVCPTEVLCEQSCVRNTNEGKPVEIGLLQRFATDNFFQKENTLIAKRRQNTGKTVAIIGAGPAGLSCAYFLAQHGHKVVIFDAHRKLGGLNEYGLATYKTTQNFAQKEIAWLLSIGGIDVKTDCLLGRDIDLQTLTTQYNAVFLAIGLGGVNALGIPTHDAQGIYNAVDFIAQIRQTTDLSTIPVGQRVLVIGGGMTAIDAAVQAKKLGAQEVSIVYRRGYQHMPASTYEQNWAKENGIALYEWSVPVDVLTQTVQNQTLICGVEFAKTSLNSAGKLEQGNERFVLPADMLLKAIGQTMVTQPLGSLIELKEGKIATSANGKTSHAKIWAGGDCRHGGRDLTVEAVEHGKLAAIDIDYQLMH